MVRRHPLYDLNSSDLLRLYRGQELGSARFLSKGHRVTTSGLQGCVSNPALPLQSECTHRQCANEWAWLCYSKTVFMKNRDLGLELASPCPGRGSSVNMLCASEERAFCLMGWNALCRLRWGGGRRCSGLRVPVRQSLESGVDSLVLLIPVRRPTGVCFLPYGVGQR